MRKRLLTMLVLLVAVVTGAWADGIVCTASDLGKVLCTDGSIYDNVSAATTAGKTAAAVIAYVNETNKNGLAIALADESSTMNWSTAKSTCEGKTPTVTGVKWCLPSQDQWINMFQANGGDSKSYTGLNTTITNAGGTTLKNTVYWSSSESVRFDGSVYWGFKTEDAYQVRACLAFDIVVPSYAVTLAEGTEDADKWTIPAEAEEGATVTVTYSGEKKVKSVKAVKVAPKPDLLSGVFSVSASKKVNFSKGNLQATYDGSSWTWAFANNQWDYIGNAAGNTKVTDASPFISENGTVDLFGWVGASSTWDGVNQYGITSSKARNATNGYGNSATENLKNDWGTLMGTGWHTLTKDEWAYMLNSRSGTSYCKAQVNSKSGLVIFPDGYTHPTGPTAPTNINTPNAAYTTNSWSGEDWTKMENAGCVFLPAAGSRDGNSVSNAGTGGYYWWSTHYEVGGDAVDRAYNLYFTNNFLLPTAGSYRDMGCSVRLVQKAPLTYPIALSAVTADYIGSVVTSDGNVYPAKTAVPAGKTAVGILGKVTETGHGLILALQDATQQSWNTINGWTSVTTYAGTTLKLLPAGALGSLTSYTTLGSTTVSNWCVAQKSDYDAIFTNLGSKAGDTDGITYDANVNAYITTGVGGTPISAPYPYWSATECDVSNGWTFYSDEWYYYTKDSDYSLRPVLGF